MSETTRRDRFGGTRDLRFRATGAFRLEHAGRWWLVTPDGGAFLGFGVNHVALDRLQRVENRSFWLGLFELPPNANADAWLAPFWDRVREDLDAFGFNHLGGHTPLAPPARDFAPYVQTIRFVEICHWQTPKAADFRDVFSRDFARHCRDLAHDIARPRLDDPYLIGYAFTDCPILTDEEAAAREATVYGAPRPATPTWPLVLRNLGPDAAGKQAYVTLMRERYGDDISAFNAVYGTYFADFGALANLPDWRPAVHAHVEAERADNDAFLALILDRYYRVTTEAVRHFDPDHLIFGDTFNGNTHTPDFAIGTAARYADLTLYQWYGTYAEQAPRLDAWSELTGKPLFNGDSCYAVPGPNMPNPLGPHFATQEARAAAFLDFAEHAYARPEFVGWSWCGWMDSWATVPGQMARQHSGLQDPYGQRYPEMVKAMSDVAARLYRIARAQKAENP